ncbi:MAG: glycosyltransferase family 4 protein [Phycisphaera sp.]|nr:glycosyltransferase family 4 protein [Phycisphaera sp.]
MRIMHISTRLILGGSQENTILSCEGQADAGHEVSLLFGPITGPEGSLRPTVDANPSIEAIETPNLCRELAPRRDFTCRRDLAKVIRRWRPDVVHTHSSKAGILGRAAAWAAQVPAVVHTIHGLPFHPYQGSIRNRIYIQAERWAARRCHAIVTVADAMRDQALAVGIGRPNQYSTIRSGMRVEPYLEHEESTTDARTRLGLPKDAFIVGTIARLAELKGHDDLLDGLGPLLQKDHKMHLLWVGDGYWAERLRRRTEELGLASQVHFSGLVDPGDIPSWIRTMDVVAHPSYREGLPRAVVQGMLSGRPVISYALDGAPEVCIDDVTGILVQPGDLVGLRTAVGRLREDSTLRHRLGDEGRRRCRTAFDWRTMVHELQSLYENLLDAGDRRHP